MCSRNWTVNWCRIFNAWRNCTICWSSYQYNLKIVSVQESKITASETDEIKTKDIEKLLKDEIEMLSQKLISSIAVGTSPQINIEQPGVQMTIQNLLEI